MPAKKESPHDILILNKWILSKFYGQTFDSIKERLNHSSYEGVEKDGNTEYFYQLTHFLFDPNSIKVSQLEEYDCRILDYWKKITDKRNKLENDILKMKYFQYISLLFTEIYLDWYFNRTEELLKELNLLLADFNQKRYEKDQFQEYEKNDLNKISFWSATGSGKTLLLHINIKQYLHYYHKKFGNDKSPDKIILLTPNEGLSYQHYEEFKLSGMYDVVFFDKSTTAPRGWVEIIDINKLGDEMGDKVVAVEAFEGQNLVLVDEGHRGTSGAGDTFAWLKRRDALCREGFSFEYSATFGQALHDGKIIREREIEKRKNKLLYLSGNTNKTEYQKTHPDRDFNSEIEKIELDGDERASIKFESQKEVYAKSILFDYSYKYFYDDGYGKESLILNISNENDDNYRKTYLTAAILTYYQQRFIFEKRNDVAEEFNIENPLWVFVGYTVKGSNKTKSDKDTESDVMSVIRFINYFTDQNNRDEIVSTIKNLLEGKSIITNTEGRNVFEKRFLPLSGEKAENIYIDIFNKVFNSRSVQPLRVVNLRGVEGEIGLRVGDEPFFGVVNIGDTAAVYKYCEDDENIITEDSEKSASLFSNINKKDSKIMVLIGSRKFTEGWSSWRVSIMTLLNMGRTEGTQIIQLFGRGVRLKGKYMSLKRTVPSERPKDSDIQHLETLNIFGIRADYIATFKKYLKEEGVTLTDEIIEIAFDTQRHSGNGKLKTLQLKDGYKANQEKGFKRTVKPFLYEIPEDIADKIKKPVATLDLYPKVDAMESWDVDNNNKGAVVKKKFEFNESVLDLFNWDDIYIELLDYKNQKSWYNLRVSKEKLREFAIFKKGWYQLFIPEKETVLDSFSKLKNLESVFIKLLKAYTEKFYEALKKVYEDDYYEYITVSEDDSSYIKEYRFDIEGSDEGRIYFKRISELAELVKERNIGRISSWNAPHMEAIVFESHLFYPLIYIEEKSNLPLKMRPLAFDAKSEVTFIKDLKSFYENEKNRDVFKGKDFYLMRNAASRSKGIGFSSAGNFFPDFLMWIVDGEKQYLTFVDPKGIRQLDIDDAKFKLHINIKELQHKLGNDDIVLNAFILSETKFQNILNNTKTQKQLEDMNLLFMEDGGQSYIEKMMRKILL